MERAAEISTDMDGGIAAAAEAGDPASRGFRSFFGVHHDFVWRNLRRLGVAPPQVDDALQDVFVIAYRRRRNLRRDASERAWLYTILRRVAYRHRRSEARKRRKLDALAAVSPAVHVDRPADRIDARRFMEEFLDGLGEKRRSVFVMIELEGMSAPEVARALGIKLNTVYSRLRLGRDAFERALAGRCQDRASSSAVRARARAADEPPIGSAAVAWIWFEPRIEGAVGFSLPAQAAVFSLTVALGTVGVLAAGAHGGAAGPELLSAAPVSAAAADPVPPADPMFAPPVVEPTIAASPAQPTAPRRIEPRPRPPRSGVDAEARLLARAHALLGAGRPEEALAELGRHEREHAGSAVEDLRDAIRIEALCAAGKSRQARAEAALFARCHPGSRVVDRVLAACPGDGSAGGRGSGG